MTDLAAGPPRRGLLRSLGPAIIVASVVLGPGSILTSSKVGCQYGYDMLWVLAGAAILMIAMVALSARLGVVLKGTPCDELARRLGRPFAAFVGIVLFLVIASFQSSNNIAVLASIEPFFESSDAPAASGAGSAATSDWLIPTIALVALNVLIVAVMYGLRKLYGVIETMMKILVVVMIVGFAANLLFARPSAAGVLGGLVPKLPPMEGLLPRLSGGKVVDPLWAVQGLIATTFSVAGAFYQAYLVREKGWTQTYLRQGLVDSVVGIALLGMITMVIMITAASALHGMVDPADLKSAGDVASQLQPLFGPAAKLLFCIGIFAGAFSSFLVNAMIGGALLSDGLGLGASMDQRWPKLLTTAALVIGMGVAIASRSFGMSRVGLIIFAQALTVLGVPILAGSLLYLATRRELTGSRRVPFWMKLLAAVGGLVTVALAVRTAWRIYLQITAP